MSFSRIPLLLAFVYAVSSEQPSAPSPISAQLRELPWASGGLNILHTTDTHGWHGGHLQEAQYSADWGDYISFAHHMRKRADDDGSDLLLVDTGDRVEGNGLYDASDPKGRYTFDIIKHQRMDVITPGNHELYLANTSSREYAEVVPDFKDAYIASNLDIWSAKSMKFEPFAPRYRRFTTQNRGVRVLALGFMFDFRGNANNTFVQPVEETVKEQWFHDALRTKDVDLFLVAGHVPVRDSQEYDLIYRAIRDVVWDTPIVFFGGHTHIRDFRKYEKTAYGIESGRYMETIGFLSITDLGSGKKDVVAAANPTFRRMYIDNNLYSMQHHSGMNKSTFSTALGRNVSQAIHAARKAMHLDHAFGCAPQDYWLNRAPYPANDSLLSLLDKQVLPDTFQHLKKPTIVITNSGAIRFDIFKGPFTIDTTFLVSPFTSGFRKLSDVPYGAASQILRLLNNEGPISLDDLAALGRGEAAFCTQEPSGTNANTRFRTATCIEGSADAVFDVQDLMPPLPPVGLRTLRRDNDGQQVPLLAGDKPTVPGYTTVDDAGDDGDDTVHQAIQFYDVPNCIGIDVGFSTTRLGEEPETVDLVYNEFIQDWVLLALRFLGKTYGKRDTEESLGGKTMTDVISEWVAEHWGCEEGV
ncbi:hypothetical protein LTR91_020301 [Friedmanniomyces endolithicus]|uniref:Uncharacterized protein n=1 Tax=Friedmanniomyces endolithicus TaxID=329885 RepID=A0A4V5N9Z9_9PEZI|nr:hypothetical protein LTR35_003128 [Friedmanniomyces endolithicus]KAK0300498.1 hypothetical protein LTS00_000753 [Friedmanniomyces endolithicus]KAK0960544.1 hypothetical protein LTR91_020301 [Friedmanniomyces endolithicus]KAK1049236.1 hypothetical protein LTS16_003938 [Friedmanniomyces endolithicus]TKA49579.1 hypothetical protein B0A54_00246 [Friedmanniomyces endolithicus]